MVAIRADCCAFNQRVLKSLRRHRILKRLAPVCSATALIMLCQTMILAQQSTLPRSSRLELPEKTVDAPVVLCIDDKPAAGGQPTAAAYAKAAANGYRSVLTLRSAKDGVDLTRERLLVEQNKLRYFNIFFASKLPPREQVDTFLKLAEDPANHPMLINCAFAERIAPLIMIFRIVDQGWTEDRALAEASQSGLKSAELKKFARAYLARQK
jgi:protein tyrosine phosphatase (PTP) superfamily phosphohydrolase (DUF442 family)